MYDITPELMQHYKAQRLKEGVAKNTINHEIALAKAFLNWLVKMRIIDQNPIAHIEKVRVPERQRAILYPEEARRLLEALEGKERRERGRYPLRDYVYLALYAGLRREEAVQLKWADVDFEGRSLTISGKGGRLRLLPLCTQLYDFLKTGPHDGTLVVDPPWWKDTVTRAFRRTCEEAGINGLTFHGLRHTFASLLTAAWVPDVAVQRLMGHTSTRTTRIYQHVDSMLRQAIEPIERLLP